MGGVCISVILKDGVESIRQGKFPQLTEMQMIFWVLPTLGEKKKRAEGENIYGYMKRGQRPSK